MLRRGGWLVVLATVAVCAAIPVAARSRKIYVYPQGMRTHYCPRGAECATKLESAMQRAGKDDAVVLLGESYKRVPWRARNGRMPSGHPVQLRRYDAVHDTEFDVHQLGRVPKHVLASQGGSTNVQFELTSKAGAPIIASTHRDVRISTLINEVYARADRNENARAAKRTRSDIAAAIIGVLEALDPYPPFSDNPHRDDDDSGTLIWPIIVAASIVGGLFLIALGFALFGGKDDHHHHHHHYALLRPASASRSAASVVGRGTLARLPLIPRDRIAPV